MPTRTSVRRPPRKKLHAKTHVEKLGQPRTSNPSEVRAAVLEMEREQDRREIAEQLVDEREEKKMKKMSQRALQVSPSSLARLSDILKRFGEDAESVGEPVRETVARYVWRVLAFGEVTLKSGRTMKFAPREWLELTKWCWNYLDPAETRIKVGSELESITSALQAMSDEQLQDAVARILTTEIQ